MIESCLGKRCAPKIGMEDHASPVNYRAQGPIGGGAEIFRDRICKSTDALIECVLVEIFVLNAQPQLLQDRARRLRDQCASLSRNRWREFWAAQDLIDRREPAEKIRLGGGCHARGLSHDRAVTHAVPHPYSVCM